MTGRPADLDRRLHAFAVDRFLAWTVDGVAVVLAWRYVVDAGAAIGVVLAVATLVLVALAVLLGRTGTSPGNALLGIRVTAVGTGVPIGVGPALLRQVVLALATLPTLGLGAATLAWTAAADPGGRRHGWHDRLVGSEVVDVRPAAVEPVAEPVAAPEAPVGVLNLTALRLVPAPAPPAAVAHPRLGHPVPREPTGPPARWRVSFDSGESVVVEGLALVGRRPEPRSGESPRHLLALPSEDMSLSKTHAQLQVATDGVLVVSDRGSTNGSVLLRRGVPRDLAAGRPTTLLDADHVRFGDRIMSVAREA